MALGSAMHIHNCSRPVPLFKPVGFVRHVVRAMTEDHFSSKVLFFCLLYYVTKLTALFKYTYWGLFLLNPGKTTATSLHSYQMVDQEKLNDFKHSIDTKDIEEYREVAIVLLES